MKRPAKTVPGRRVIAMALTWDGARWPTRALPPKARAFLTGKSHDGSLLPPQGMAKLFADDRIREMRICWVPRLKGGKGTLSTPFATPTGKRIAFRAARRVGLGEILGVVYRRV